MGRPGKKGDIWVELGAIGGENSRKPVFGFWLLGEKEFCTGRLKKQPAKTEINDRLLRLRPYPSSNGHTER